MAALPAACPGVEELTLWIEDRELTADLQAVAAAGYLRHARAGFSRPNRLPALTSSVVLACSPLTRLRRAHIEVDPPWDSDGLSLAALADGLGALPALEHATLAFLSPSDQPGASRSLARLGSKLCIHCEVNMDAEFEDEEGGLEERLLDGSCPPCRPAWRCRCG